MENFGFANPTGSRKSKLGHEELEGETFIRNASDVLGQGGGTVDLPKRGDWKRLCGAKQRESRGFRHA